MLSQPSKHAGPATVETGVPRIAPDGNSLRSATLVYKGLHQGEHQAWAYQQTRTLVAAERAGRPIWRRNFIFADDTDFSYTLEVDRRTLAPIHSEYRFGPRKVWLDYSPGQTTGVIEEKGTTKNVAYRHKEPKEPILTVEDETLDLFLAALPLAPGFETRVALINVWMVSQTNRFEPRVFTVRVNKEDVVKVPAGELAVFVVGIDPTDGDERNKSVYHMSKARPHYAVRMEYVVHPGVGKERRSVGVDELVSSSVQP